MTQRLLFSRFRLAGVLLAGTLTWSACRGEESTPPETADAAARAVADTSGVPDDIYIAEDAADDSPPPVIYYDLTRFDWYARGEPLVHEGWRYSPAGLVSAGGAEMQHAGEYGGVAFYQRRDGAADSLFVPVFERYWLVFNPADRSDAAAPATGER